jgi:hypothetical protein
LKKRNLTNLFPLKGLEAIFHARDFFLTSLSARPNIQTRTEFDVLAMPSNLILPNIALAKARVRVADAHLIG